MPEVGLDPRCDTLVGLPHLLNSESTGPIRFEVGESSSLSDPRPLTHEAHEPVMTASSKTGHDISDTQTEMLGRPAELVREVDGSVSSGFNAEESPTTPGKADTMQTHSFLTAMNSVCVHEVAAPQAEAMGQPGNSFMEVECPLSEGFHAGEPLMTLGKAETESDRVSMGLFLFNLFLSLSRARIAELGVQGGDKGGWVDFVRVAQGIEIPNQVDQLVVSTDCGYPEARVSTEREVVSADLGLGDVDSPSPLMTITPLGLAVPVELNSGDEVMGLENTLNISSVLL